MKKDKISIKEIIFNIFLCIVVVFLIFLVGAIVLYNLKVETQMCRYDNDTPKIGIQEYNCSEHMTFYDEIYIGDNCYINCSVPIEAI